MSLLQGWTVVIKLFFSVILYCWKLCTSSCSLHPNLGSQNCLFLRGKIISWHKLFWLHWGVKLNLGNWNILWHLSSALSPVGLSAGWQTVLGRADNLWLPVAASAVHSFHLLVAASGRLAAQSQTEVVFVGIFFVQICFVGTINKRWAVLTASQL